MKLKPFKIGIVNSNDVKDFNFNQMVYIIDEIENFYIVKVENNSKTTKINKDKIKVI